MRTDPGPDERDDADETLGSPYGPFPHGVDESAGGADSSPFENESTEERKDVADDDGTDPAE